MNIIKCLLFVFCLSCLAAATTGISIRVVGDDAEIIKQSINYRLYNFALFLVFATCLYGIQKKVLIVWKLGWLVLFGSFIDFEFFVVSDLIKHQKANPSPLMVFWVFIIFTVVTSTAAVVYWSLWWERQKHHFIK
jgi:hypothetical protein